MIRFDCASINGFLNCADLSLLPGKTYAVLAETDFERSQLLKIISGLILLNSGKLYVFDKNMSSITYIEMNETRKRIGIVQRNGGLISNLKVWENILLPLSYHESLSYQDTEEKLKNLLDKIGYDDELTTLPGSLPPYKKRLIGFVRSMMINPDIIIYDSVFEGLSYDIRAKVSETVQSFHKEKQGRVSLFLESSMDKINYLKIDKVFILEKGNFHERN